MSYKMVIVTGKVGSLKQAEQYLRNRQWDIFSTDNLKEAIAEAVKRKVDFVMISADHPNKRVKNLPKLLNQAIPTARLIGYIESNSRAAINALSDLHFEYVVYPPVSGPSVERAVLKIIKEEKEVETRKNVKDELGTTVAGAAKDEVFVAKGEKMKPGYAAVQSSAKGPAADLQKEMMKAMSSAKAVEPGVGNRGKFFYGGSAIMNPNPPSEFESSQDTATSTHRKRSAQQRNDLNSETQQGNLSDPFEADWSGLEGDDPLGPAPGVDKSAPAAEEKNRKQTQNPARGPYIPNIPEEPKNNLGPYLPSIPIDPVEAPSPAETLAKAPLGVSFDTNPPATPSKEPQLGELGPKGTRKPLGFKHDEKKMPEQDSLFAQLTQRALDESVNGGGADKYESLGEGQQFACIVVKSPKFSGYLIAGLGDNREVDMVLMTTIKTKLFQILREQGEEISESEPMQLELEQVALEDWAFNQGRFLKKAIHDEKEIALAFFQGDDISPKLEQSEIEYMLKLKIEGLELESDLDFDLYIFLPTNNRLLLYTPNGRRVAIEQRTRLTDKGITHLHLRKESQSLVQRYHTRARLNEKIISFRSKNKEV